MHIGFGGESNWMTHINGGSHTRAQAALQKNKVSNYFLKAPVQPTPSSSVIPPTHLSNRGVSSAFPLYSDGPQTDLTSASNPHMIDENQDGGPKAIDPSGSLIDRLRVATRRLPKTVLVGTEVDILAQFSGAPFVDLDEYDDAWEMVDRTLNGVIGYGMSVAAVSAIIRRGKFGMDGLCNWLETCISEYGINPELLEGKVDRLLDAINLLYVLTLSGSCNS